MAFFNSNGYLTVWHCIDPAGAPGVNDWTVLPDTYSDAETFVRLTIKTDYRRDAHGYFNFSLYLNDRLLELTGILTAELRPFVPLSSVPSSFCRRRTCVRRFQADCPNGWTKQAHS